MTVRSACCYRSPSELGQKSAKKEIVSMEEKTQFIADGPKAIS